MFNQAPPGNKKSSVEDAEPNVAHLFRRLLSELPANESRKPVACHSFAENQQGEEIICDLVIDGAHYLLVRLHSPAAPAIQLSPREQEIVRMVAQGHPNKIIADVLNISSWTVCTHLRRIFAKLGVGSRAAMVARIMGTDNGWEKRATSPQHKAQLKLAEIGDSSQRTDSVLSRSAATSEEIGE